MPNFIFHIDLPAELLLELETACFELHMSKNKFAGQCVEATLASRRLPNVPAGPKSPILPCEGEERDTVAILPGGVTLDDLPALDINGY